MGYDYVWEKFHLAVRDLASGKDSFQKRLADIYMVHLSHVGNHEMPDEIREDFERLQTALTQEQPKSDEGSVVASVRVMSEVEVLELIDLIVSMYDRVAKYGPNARA
jgi:cell division septum initiation protein DivIVA